MADPICAPVYRDAAFLPTTSSYRPGANIRPCSMRTPCRTLNAIGETPRTVTLTSAPSVVRGRFATTTISGDASGFAVAVARHARVHHDRARVVAAEPGGQLARRSALRHDRVQGRSRRSKGHPEAV